MVGKGEQWRLGRLFQRTWAIFVWRGRSSVLQAHCCQLRHVERNSSDKRADKNMDAALRGLPSRGLGNTRKHMDCGGKIVRFREGWKEGTGHCQCASNSVSPLISLIPRHSFLSWLTFSLGGKNHKDSSPPTSEMPYEPGLQIGDQNFRVLAWTEEPLESGNMVLPLSPF